MDPIESSTRWHQWTMKGANNILAKVLDDLDGRFPHEWKRLNGTELQPYQPLVRAGSAWYAYEMTSTCAGITLSVERFGNSELRGGRVWCSGPPHMASAPNVPAAWDQVMRFLDVGVVPAAHALGCTIRIPTPEDTFISELPPEIADRLRKFSKAARKLLPLNREEADVWSAFVVGAFRAKAVIEPRQFTNWLVMNGWTVSGSAELNLRFVEQSRLLSQYADEASAA